MGEDSIPLVFDEAIRSYTLTSLPGVELFKNECLKLEVESARERVWRFGLLLSLFSLLLLYRRLEAAGAVGAVGLYFAQTYRRDHARVRTAEAVTVTSWSPSVMPSSITLTGTVVA